MFVQVICHVMFVLQKSKIYLVLKCALRTNWWVKKPCLLKAEKVIKYLLLGLMTIHEFWNVSYMTIIFISQIHTFFFQNVSSSEVWSDLDWLQNYLGRNYIFLLCLHRAVDSLHFLTVLHTSPYWIFSCLHDLD